MAKRERKSRWILLAIIMVFIVVAFGLFLKEKPKVKKGITDRSIKIGISLYTDQDTYIDTIITELEEQVKVYEQKNNVKINLNVVGGKNNQNIQNEQVERFISLGYDVICVNAVDRTNISTIVDQTTEAGIPVVFFNREPVEDDLSRGNQTYYVGSDAQESAELQGELIGELFKETPSEIDKNGNGIIEYAILEGEVGHQDAIIRTEWSVKTLVDEGVAVERITSGVANWAREQGAALVEQWMEKYPGKIELIICNNDDMALGALDALKKLEIHDVQVVGIDGTNAGIAAVNAGEMLGTVKADVRQYAKTLFQLSYNLGRGTKIPKDLKLVDGTKIWIDWKKHIKKEIVQNN